VLFQLPPNLKADAQLLEEFLAALPRGVASAFEFRHTSWFTDEIFNLLNHPNWDVADANPTSSSFGKVTNKFGQRQIQFALKYIF